MFVALFGDVHGAIDVMYEWCLAWQRRTGRTLAAVLQAGDMGAFPSAERLDKATAKKAQKDPTELQIIDYIAGRKTAPIETIFVHGNHEDFEFLAEHRNGYIDPAGRIFYLASGGTYTLKQGRERLRIAGLGGIEPRKVKHPELPKYIQPEEKKAIMSLEPGSVDVLLTHDGPIGRCLADVRSAGSIAVYDAVKHLQPKYHFFGHYDRPLPPSKIGWTPCICLNNPSVAQLPGRDGSMAILNTSDWSVDFLTEPPT